MSRKITQNGIKDVWISKVKEILTLFAKDGNDIRPMYLYR